MASKFHFVDVSNTDKASRRQMRRHVMKGVNLGRKIHRPSKQKLVKRQQLYLCRRSGEEVVEREYAHPQAFPRDFENAFLSVMLPIEVAPSSLQIINDFFVHIADRLYPAQLGVSVDEAKIMWLPALFADVATSYCSIALMQACNAIFTGQGYESPQASYYLSQTYSQVNKRLQSPSALSDSTMALVVSLVNQEQIRRIPFGAETHLKGLRQMIQLRGGLDQLEHNRPLTLKICKVDIVCTLQFGGPTMFFRDRMPHVRTVLASQGIKFDRVAAEALVRHRVFDAFLHDIIIDIICVCTLFNHEIGRRKLDLLTFQEMEYSLCYRLLKFRALNDAPKTPVQAAYHIGLLMLMMTTFLRFDRRRVLDYRLTTLELKNTLDNWPDDGDNELLLWLTTVGGIWISGDLDSEWLHPKIREVSQNLGLASWDAVLGVVKKFPWLHALHDMPGRELWGRV